MKLKRLKYARNKQELTTYIQAEMAEVLNDVGDEMLGRLDEIIVRDVYTYDYFPNIRYWGLTKFDVEDNAGFLAAQPTFQFRDAWRKEIGTGNPASVSIKFDSSQIGKEHNSIIEPKRDVSEYIADILNVDRFTSDLQFGRPPGKFSHNDPGTLRHVSKMRKPYWDNFMREMRGGSVRKWIKEKAQRQGLNIQ